MGNECCGACCGGVGATRAKGARLAAIGGCAEGRYFCGGWDGTGDVSQLISSSLFDFRDGGEEPLCVGMKWIGEHLADGS